MKKSFNKNIKLLWLLFGLGLILITSGIVFEILYFNHEVIDKTHAIKEVNNYYSENVSLENGEIVITKDVKHLGKGMFKITYKNKYKTSENSSIFEKDSNFIITDIIGESFVIEDNLVTINGNTIKLGKENVVTAEYDVSYKKNIFEISIPSSLLTRDNIIEITVKLIDKTPKIKHKVSEDSYYSFTPSIENDFYKKKSYQSYVIKDTSYIIIKKI